MTLLAPDRFLLCLPHTLAQECPFPADWSNPKNFSNDRGDPGGATMCGITHREYDLYRKHHGLPTRDVRLMTQSEGEDIYLDFFWLPNCPKLPAGLDLEFFDSSVNEGTTEATRILQVALGIHNDGEWGPRTQAAVDALRDVGAAVRAFTDRRSVVYRQTANFRLFGADWERRDRAIGAASIAMARGASP